MNASPSILVASLLPGTFPIWSFFRNRRRHKLLSVPLSDPQRELISDRVWAYRGLNDQQRKRFEDCVRIIIGERRWEGYRDLQVTEEMQLTIAAHASLMLLGAPDYYFQTVTTILIFPMMIKRSNDGRTTVSTGEAWQSGGVLLSWPEVGTVGQRQDGHNVVIHEFAHHLDGLDGEMGGSIPFANDGDQARWHEVADREFQHLREDVHRGRPTLFDEYGAYSMAEFFAVTSECFFERPVEMHRYHPDLFALMKIFYHIDPLQWCRTT